MVQIYNYFLLVALVAAASAIPLAQYQYDPEEIYQAEVDSPVAIAQELYRLKRSQYDQQPLEDVYDIYTPQEAYELHRARRSLQPGAPGFPQPQKQGGGWSLNPDLGRDESGNTRGQVEVNHKGNNHDFNAGWGKVIRGPNKAKPTWHVGGTFKW